jgi:hypothetical protein
MVRLKGPLFSLKAQKQIGKTIIFKSKNNRAFLTKYSKPGSKRKFTPSENQQIMRGYMQDGRESWASLDQSDKDAWNNFVIPKHGE